MFQCLLAAIGSDDSAMSSSFINIESVLAQWWFSLFFHLKWWHNKQKNLKKNSFLLASWRSMTKISGSESGSISHRHGSPDPDPHQNVMHPEHCHYQRSISLSSFLMILYLLPLTVMLQSIFHLLWFPWNLLWLDSLWSLQEKLSECTVHCRFLMCVAITDFWIILRDPDLAQHRKLICILIQNRPSSFIFKEIRFI